VKKEHKKMAIAVSIFLILVLSIFNLAKISRGKSKTDNLTNKNLSLSNKTQNISKNEKNLDSQNEASSDVIDERNFKGEKLKYNNKSVPVLMYHSINYEKGNELRVPKEVFREQMKYLKDKGYTTLTLDEFYDFLINNKPVPEKSVVITFDDGYKDNYENAYPILKEFGFNATIFDITSTVDTDNNYLTSSQLKELEVNNIDIESHTVNHEQLDKLIYTKQVNTLKDSEQYLGATRCNMKSIA
jgi:hypothetical protein